MSPPHLIQQFFLTIIPRGQHNIWIYIFRSGHRRVNYLHCLCMFSAVDTRGPQARYNCIMLAPCQNKFHLFCCIWLCHSLEYWYCTCFPTQRFVTFVCISHIFKSSFGSFSCDISTLKLCLTHFTSIINIIINYHLCQCNALIRLWFSECLLIL